MTTQDKTIKKSDIAFIGYESSDDTLFITIDGKVVRVAYRDLERVLAYAREEHGTFLFNSMEY